MHWYVPLGEIVHHYIQTNIENRTLVENLKNSTEFNAFHRPRFVKSGCVETNTS